ncbi:fumarate hydratase [Pigmentiphaga litoralis]|uniref:Fumarate hydratase subunit alpha n=1 Tax=Pigmentiphaga litoralis TaxID=516702 RepID=A0A7Y9IQA8_9BURK|nr:fumarate hydratase [Pigmentiphaga litoralis]NYE25277.1 fumarate hydratase subunit alpha [Pigmentiphaga litoralis]NYE81110.1 fumarate hydratase subunit alpha [Pigmentiphaga litoralis]
MAISSSTISRVTADLYNRSLRGIPADTRAALVAAERTDSSPIAKNTLRIMVDSADAAARNNHFVCSDAGVPVYFARVGTQAQFEGDVRQAITDGFAELVATIQPPLLPHITHPLTLERGHAGKGMPITTFDLVDGSDYLDITCSPKALGSGRWAALEIFSFPNMETIERFVIDTVIKAGSQPCPPVVIGVGVGGTFDYAAKMAKEATLRPIGIRHAEPMVADMELRLANAINKTGFGPMGTGGDSTAMTVNVEYCSGHGFTPVAVSFNCWINRRTRARIYNDNTVVFVE